jgi:hypothetical protein
MPIPAAIVVFRLRLAVLRTFAVTAAAGRLLNFAIGR